MSRFKQYISSKNKSLFETTQKVMALVIVFSQIVAPIGPVFNLGQVEATSSGGYTAELTSPTPAPPTSSDTYTWTIDGSKPIDDPQGRKEISNVRIDGCWLEEDIKSITSSSGNHDSLTDKSIVHITGGINDDALPLTITVTFNTTFPSTGTADVFVKTGGGNDAGFDFETPGPSCDFGSVKVNKQVDANGDGVYEGGNKEANNLGFLWGLDTETPARTMGSTKASVPVGAHNVTENDVPGYTLTGWFIGDSSSCEETQNSDTQVPLTVVKNVTTTLTLCNQTQPQNGEIVVTKQTYPDGSNQGFQLITSTTDGEVLGSDDVDNIIHNDETITFDVTPGTYDINEKLPTGWQQTSTTCENVTVAAGETATCVIENTKLATIIVEKLVSPDNAEGVFTFSGDVSGTINLPGDNQLEATGVLPGQYSSTETDQSHWDLSSIFCDDNNSTGNVETATATFHVEAGETIICTFTNTRDTGSLTLLKNIVNNNNGDADETDFTPLINDQTLIQEQTVEWGEKLTLTSGQKYEAGETFAINDYKQQGVECYMTDAPGESIEHPVMLAANSDVTCEITNRYVERGSVVVTKFHDLYLDEQYDAVPQPGQEVSDPLLDGWTVFLNKDTEIERSGVTGANENTTGQYVFDGLKPGFYDLSEDLESQEGWSQSTLYCNGETYNEEINQLIVEEDLVRETGNVFVAPGQTVECFIGNFTDIELELSKRNNQTAPQRLGENIIYTLEVSVPEDSGVSHNTVVTDLPPEGFEVDNSSWTATSSRNGHNVANDVGSGPQYSSPGMWSVGTLYPGEVVTLTYTATITSDVSPGEYPDMAYATGQQFPEETETLTYSNLHITEDDPFVETAVQVIDDPGTDAVFAAARTVTITELPNTGPAWLDAILVPVGLASLYYMFTRRKWYKQIGGRI